MTASSASAMHTTLSQVVSRWFCSDGNDGTTSTLNNRTVLILDSLESDGRFVLGTLVSSLLSPRPDYRTTAAQQYKRHNPTSKKDSDADHRILWLNCTTMTDQLTLAALQKFGCPKSVTSTAHLPESSSSTSTSSTSLLEQSVTDSALTIRSVPALVRRMMMESHVEEENETMDLESIVKSLYRQVKTWLCSKQQQQRVADNKGPVDKGQKWVILDDVSTLAVLVGERLAYGLILSIRALSANNCSSEHHAFGLVIRASNDYDIERSLLVDPRSTHWFGGTMDNADDGIDDGSKDDDECPWERQLVEMADTVVDVVPLASGYSREVHGRLIFTSKAAPAIQQDCYNYCLTDNQALVIRVVR